MNDRLSAIAWIQDQMARHEIHLEDLERAECFAPPRYRNAEGQIWNGIGPLPDWLARAVNAGQSITFFRIE
jgi:DNA-binding protein H-NS